MSYPPTVDAELDALPPIVAASLSLLAKNLHVSGLFRESATKGELDATLAQWGGPPFNGPPVTCTWRDINLASLDIHTVAGIPKAYFRSDRVPPLIPRSVQGPLAALSMYDADSPAMLSALKGIVDSLAPEQYALLLPLCRMLHATSAQSAVNSMTSVNLAVCWTPTLLRAGAAQTFQVSQIIQGFPVLFGLEEGPAATKDETPVSAESGEVRWGAWIECDDGEGNVYYWNEITDASVWEPPPGWAPEVGGGGADGPPPLPPDEEDEEPVPPPPTAAATHSLVPPPVPSSTRPSSSVAAVPTPSLTPSLAPSLAPPMSASAGSPAIQLAKATHTFTGQTAGDISFVKGDQIQVFDSTKNWWTGRKYAASGPQTNPVGVFPGNYVKPTNFTAGGKPQPVPTSDDSSTATARIDIWG